VQILLILHNARANLPSDMFFFKLILAKIPMKYIGT